MIIDSLDFPSTEESVGAFKTIVCSCCKFQNMNSNNSGIHGAMKMGLGPFKISFVGG